MIIEYKIDEKDFLIHQLYAASKSAQIKKLRQKNKVIVPVVYIALGLILWHGDDISWLIIFTVLGVLWYFIYPHWARKRNRKFYQGFVRENYKERFGKISMVEIRDDFIIAKDDSSESKVSTTELMEINEIIPIIFVRLKDGPWYIFPKDKINNVDDLITRLKQLATTLNIPYNLDNEWKWK